jgi:ornithine cyclodeaminase/alanine dehydrogenase-like protein (mu-crystallin family)
VTSRPAVWISEAEVVGAIDLVGAARAVRAALVGEHAGEASTLDKTVLAYPGGTVHALGGVAPTLGLAGTKSWVHTGRGATPLVLLWGVADGSLRAVVEAFALGQLRTAAVTAVATDALARPEASVLAIVGTGRQALAQVAAVASCRTLVEVRVHSRDPAHRDAFRAAVADRLPDVAIVDCADAATAASGADIVVTATRATSPVLHAAMLGARTHVNAIGAITRERREIDDSVVAAASIVVSDSPDAAREHSSELDVAPFVTPLADVVAVPAPPEGTSVFKAMGLGLADVAVAAAVLDAVATSGAGRPIPRPKRAEPSLFSRRRSPADEPIP